jgi:glutathione S-transferase
MMLKLYGFSKVNAYARGHTRDLRVLWALEEMQLPFELVGMDHPAHDLNTEAYRRLSPFEQIPAIDDDGLVLSESAAIVVYLAKKSGRLIPGDAAGKAQVIRWCFTAMNSVEPPLLSLMVHDWTADGSCSKPRDFLVGRVNRVLTNLERWFADRKLRRDKRFHGRRHPDVACAALRHQRRGIDRNVSASRLVSRYVPGQTGVEAHHRRVLRSGRGGIDSQSWPRAGISSFRLKAPCSLCRFRSVRKFLFLEAIPRSVRTKRAGAGVGWRRSR